MKVKLNYFLMTSILMIHGLYSFGQKNRNRSFVSGYYYAFIDDTANWNNAFIIRNDTGVSVSERFPLEYDLFGTQTSVLCDSEGSPLLIWEGCFILDARNMTPIYNGDFSQSTGTNKSPAYYCQQKVLSTGETYHTGYAVPYFSFFLDRGDSKDIKLIYSRNINERPRLDSFQMFFATINLNGSPEGGPAVISIDSLPFTPIITNAGSVNAIRHANGIDWYIVFLERGTANHYSILYNEEGLHEPKLSAFNEWDDSDDRDGYSAVSPLGDKYAYMAQQPNRFFVTDFDRCTGKFSNIRQDSFPDLKELLTGPFRFCEFSPSGRFLYVNSLLDIYQYDLEADDFKSSQTFIAAFDTAAQPTPWPRIYGYFSNMFRGYDGRIYIWSANTVPYISRMNTPDQKADVGLVQDYMHMPFYQPWLVPKLIDFELGPIAGNPCESSTTSIRDGPKFNVFPNPTSGVLKIEGDQLDLYSRFEISDVQGKIVGTGTFGNPEIDVGDLQPGVYFMTLKNMNNLSSGTVKFVKIK